MIRKMAVVGVVTLALVVVAAQATPYVWVGPTNADWLTAANWSPAGFVNDPTNVCDINSGGTARITTSNASFQGQISLNNGASLVQAGYIGTSTIGGSLHLNGGAVTMGAANALVVTGGISVDAGSSLSAPSGDNNTVTAAFGGSGNLAVTNNQPSNRNLSMNVSNSSAYAGVMTLGGTGNYALTGKMGGTIHVNPTILGISYNCSKGTYGASPVNWELDLNGKTLTFGSENNEQTGLMTLLSNAVIQSATDYSGKYTTLSGKITGAGKLTLYSNNSRGVGILSLIVNNSTNSYSGGTEIKGGPTEAKTANALGTGNVEVDPGAQLQVDVTGVIGNAASLYLDLNSTNSTYGKLNLLDSSVTTVASAFIGGTGGWAAPIGYTALAPGTYTSANLSNYITGPGTLVVLPEPMTMVLLISGLVFIRRSRA